MKQLETALAYSAAGLSIIPIRADGSKAAALNTWVKFQENRPDEDIVGIAGLKRPPYASKFSPPVELKGWMFSDRLAGREHAAYSIVL